MDVSHLLLVIPVLLLSVIVHEVAHGWVALKEGDPTAYMLGRLTLNPLPHIDLFGSILFPLMLWVSQVGVLFGWAKPVPVNSRNFRHFRRGDILVSLAGIVSNLVLALGFAILSVAMAYVVRQTPDWADVLSRVQLMFGYGVTINLVLAFFNLIPIPPLDGSHVFYYLLPARVGARYREFGRYGMLVLLAVFLFVPQVVSAFLWPAKYLGGLLQGFMPGPR